MFAESDNVAWAHWTTTLGESPLRMLMASSAAIVYLGTASLKRITVVNTQCRESTDEQFHVVKNTMPGAPA